MSLDDVVAVVAALHDGFGCRDEKRDQDQRPQSDEVDREQAENPGELGCVFLEQRFGTRAAGLAPLDDGLIERLHSSEKSLFLRSPLAQSVKKRNIALL